MLKKEDFIIAINYIIDEREREEKFDKALKEFAPSDFTGFWRDDNRVVKWLSDVMGDKYENISWWLYDTDAGRNKDMCKITFGEPDDPDYKEWDILTAGDLYDYIVEEQREELEENESDHQDTIFRIGRKAQTEGVRYALNEIARLNRDNEDSANPGWAHRKALLTLLYNNIINHYLADTGLDPTSRDDLELFTSEEDCA